MIWITADTHFCHEKLWKEGYRPEGFEKLILDRLNNTLRPGDVLLHLGDVSLYPAGTEMTKAFLAGLNDVKTWLVRGNHDGKSAGKYLEEGWDWCADSMELDYKGKDLVFTHRPLPSDEFADGGLNIHGHLHSGEHRGAVEEDGRHILISQELLDYRPIGLDTVLQLATTPRYIDGHFRKRKLSC